MSSKVTPVQAVQTAVEVPVATRDGSLMALGGTDDVVRLVSALPDDIEVAAFVVNPVSGTSRTLVNADADSGLKVAIKGNVLELSSKKSGNDHDCFGLVFSSLVTYKLNMDCIKSMTIRVDYSQHNHTLYAELVITLLEAYCV